MSLAQLMEQSGQDQGQIQGISEEEKERMRAELEEQIRREMMENEQMASRMDSGNQWDSEVDRHTHTHSLSLSHTTLSHTHSL